MGDKDLIKPLLERRGEVHFGRVLMKPGKPLTFATLDLQPPAPAPAPVTGTGTGTSSTEDPRGRQRRRMLVFGLPGNPVSSFACFHLVALPALRKMMGWAQPGLRRVQVGRGWG